MIRRAYLWAEMIALFFAVPAMLALVVDPQGRAARLFAGSGLGFLSEIERPTRLLMPALILFTLLVLTRLLLDRSFDRRRLWNRPAARSEAPRLAFTCLAAMIAMTLIGVALHGLTDVLTITRPDGSTTTALFRLPRELPIAVPLILVFYPWLSAYPQEITHRAFFFHRYRAILPGRWSMITVNAIAFMWLHVPFWHWMALALTLPGGVLFAWTYDRTKSTLAATIEHGLLGWWAFVVGLGWFVFTGSIG